MADTQAPATQVLHAVSTTWARDSHDLFDYEARHVDTKTFRVNGPVQFTRAGTEVTAHQDQGRGSLPINGNDYLLRVAQRENGGYTVYPAERNGAHPGPRKLWLVVRDLQTRGHFLQEGDIFKLGRFKLRVRQMVPSTGPGAVAVQPELQLDETEARTAGTAGKGPDVTTEEDLSTIPCRICLLEGPSDDDPLISSCSCNGSIRYVHLGCLRHWIKGRLNLSDTSNGTYFYKQLTCELCHAAYPAYVHVNGERVPLVPVPKTQPPFIVLENLVRESQQHNNRGLHVISLAEKKLLKLGRGHESDVRIADVSISRCHATIRYQSGTNGGNFILEDHSSKFGTLVVIKKPKQMDVGMQMSVQVGRTVLQMSVENQEQGVEAITGQLAATSLT